MGKTRAKYEKSFSASDGIWTFLSAGNAFGADYTHSQQKEVPSEWAICVNIGKKMKGINNCKICANLAAYGRVDKAQYLELIGFG